MQGSITVREVVTIIQATFSFTEPFTGGEVIPVAGALIGRDGEIETRTPVDNMMIVMPAERLWKGPTAVRLAEWDT